MGSEISLGAWIILGTQVMTLLGATVTIIISVMNRREVKQLSINVDGRLTQLLDITRASSHAEGRLEGIEVQKENGK
jgi:hypothetical protein